MKYEIKGVIEEIGTIPIKGDLLSGRIGVVIGCSEMGGKFFLPMTQAIAQSLSQRGFLYEKVTLSIDFTVTK